MNVSEFLSMARQAIIYCAIANIFTFYGKPHGGIFKRIEVSWARTGVRAQMID